MDLSVSQRALTDFDTSVTGNHRIERPPQSPGFGSVTAAHFQHIAETLCGDNAGLRPLAFEQGIGADSGTVNYGCDCREVINAAADPFKEAYSLIGRR